MTGISSEATSLRKSRLLMEQLQLIWCFSEFSGFEASQPLFAVQFATCMIFASLSQAGLEFDDSTQLSFLSFTGWGSLRSSLFTGQMHLSMV